MQPIPQPSGADFPFTLTRQQVGFVYSGLIHLASELARYKDQPDKPPHALLALLHLRDINPDLHQQNTRAIFRVSQMMLDALKASGSLACDGVNLAAARLHLDLQEQKDSSFDLAWSVAALNELDSIVDDYDGDTADEVLHVAHGELLQVEPS